jgi:hypothetical protein
MENISLEKEFFVIAETDRLVLGAIWESLYLVDKEKNLQTYFGDCDGLVDIGIISEDNSWAITGREKLFLWRDGQTTTIDKKELSCVEGIKRIGNDTVELEVDTLNLNGNKSTWTLNTKTLELTKLK